MKPDRIDSVFHPSDFSRGDDSAFAHSLRIAQAAKAELSLLHVERPDDDVDWHDFPRVRGTLVNWGLLAEGASAADVAALGLRVKKVQRRDRDTSWAISDYVREEQPDLVVLSTHQRHGLSRWLHAAVAEPVARAARALTLVVPRRVLGFVSPESGKVNLHTVLIPVDQSPSPQLAVDAAALLARTLGGEELHFVFLHIGDEEDMPTVKLPAETDWTQEERAWAGPVVDHILASAETCDADLIVMATQGHKGFLDAFRGSTTERVLRGAKCPVLAVAAN